MSFKKHNTSRKFDAEFEQYPNQIVSGLCDSKGDLYFLDK